MSRLATIPGSLRTADGHRRLIPRIQDTPAQLGPSVRFPSLVEVAREIPRLDIPHGATIPRDFFSSCHAFGRPLCCLPVCSQLSCFFSPSARSYFSFFELLKDACPCTSNVHSFYTHHDRFRTNTPRDAACPRAGVMSVNARRKVETIHGGYTSYNFRGTKKMEMGGHGSAQSV